MKELILKIEKHLKIIYGTNYRPNYIKDIESLINKWVAEGSEAIKPLTEKNIYLITYADAIYKKDEKTLKTLNDFLNKHLKDTITDVHILPMFEYTSDDGFSVVDYRKIKPEFGDWDDIKRLGSSYRMMYDFVANHISKSSDWFKGYLAGDEKYQNYFIEENKNFDTSKVIRPRVLPLFHKYNAKKGEVSVWTTFSEDQVDVNVSYFPVLLELTDVLLFYAYMGASSIRLDAIGFMWKESGTSCMSLKQTHEIVKLWRSILDYIKPNIQIITETNVPHDENISYFGRPHEVVDSKSDTEVNDFVNSQEASCGKSDMEVNDFADNDEASQVYQFALPPLVLYTYTVNNSKKISAWASGIDRVSDTATFFNFLSSHDGIGIRPVTSILTEDEINLIIEKVKNNGGRVSYKRNVDGSESAYELNINYQDALINENEKDNEDIEVKKIFAANAILFSMVGVPAIYYHSILGSRNDYKGLEESQINRRINREKLEYDYIDKELSTNKRRMSILSGVKKLASIRSGEKALSPYARQRVLDYGESIFAFERINENERIVCLYNVTANDVVVDNLEEGIDLITNSKIGKSITMKAYQVVWIKY